LTVLFDDHLLRDWMVGPDAALSDMVGDRSVVTTNLWYARLCKSAARATAGALLRDLPEPERRAVTAALIALPETITIVPMRQLAYRMGQLIAEERGLSTLGAEAVAAASDLDAEILVSSRDDGPGVRNCCGRLGITYRTVTR